MDKLGAITVLVLLGITALGFAWEFGAAYFKRQREGRIATFDQLDAKRVQMEAEQVTQEDQWIADLERLIGEQKANLTILRLMPPTIENLQARGEAVVSIGGAERTLGMLYDRRDHPHPNDRRQSAASHFEGRM